MLGAQLLSDAMKESGVHTVFSLSGNQIMPIYDACLDPGIRIIHTRHESSTIFMADAHAQLTGEVSVALVTAAPGFANALGGLYSALMAESPVVFISGDAPISHDGKRAFQELAQPAISKSLVKYSERVESADDMAACWYRCVCAASGGRPGPVHLSIPFDLLTAETNASHVDQAAQGANAHMGRLLARFEPDMQDIDDLQTIFRGVTRPLIFTGPALNQTRAAELLSSLEERLQAPVICIESPRGLADPALGYLRQLIKESDCVMLFGKKPDFTVAYANPYDFAGTELVLVEPDPEEFEQSVDVLEANVRMGLNALVNMTAHLLLMTGEASPPRPEWLSRAKELIDVEPPVPTVEAAANTLLPSDIMQIAQRVIERCDHPVVVCDGGEFGQWAQAFSQPRNRVINGPSGAIGGSLPAAIAASIALPEATVFAFMGDGTIGFHLSEFETSNREQAPVIVIVGNDSCWNAEHQIQLREYGPERTHSCHLTEAVRYDIAASGLGASGVFVQTADELEEALLEAMTRKAVERKSTCINVMMTGVAAPTYEYNL